MSVTFTKLFSSITESTVWCEPDHVRLLWITMLAMADRHGRVWGSIPGLANRARITVESARDGISRFMSPDPDSRTPDNEGRRIEPIDGGWRLLNHEKYRAIRDEQSILESKRKYINARREKERKNKDVENVDRCRANAEADTEADTEALTSKSKTTAPRDKSPDAVNVATSDAVITIPLVGGGEYPVSKEFAAELEALYPAVDMPQTLREIRAWNLANTKNRKTASGIKRHINQWFAKDQNRG